MHRLLPSHAPFDMPRSQVRHRAFVYSWAALFVGLLCASSARGQEPMTLRINDVEARPGGVAAVVVRTYAPRGIEQGQLCFDSEEVAEALGGGFGGGGSPFVALEDVVVFSSADDVDASASFDPLTQNTVVAFSSLSGTINDTDGPLAVFFFRLADDLSPGSQFALHFDAADTFLFDPEGEPVPLQIRGGELEVLAPGDAFSLSAEGDEAEVGGWAQLGVSTSEQLLLASGRVTFLFDPTVAIAPPVVTFDPRHGEASFTTNLDVPGRVVIDFESAEGTLNTVPGQWAIISLLIDPDLPPGASSVVRLDPASTSLQDADGTPILLELAQDVLELVAPEVLFADGFETGDFSFWSRAQP